MQDLVCIVFVPVTRIAIVWSTSHMICWIIQIIDNRFSRGNRSRTNIDWNAVNFPKPYSKADGPTAHMSTAARCSISLARCIHCCPSFLNSFTLPASLYCEEYVRACVCPYIYTYVAAYRLYMNYRCYQITLRVKDFYTNLERCEVLTGYLSFGPWPDGILTLDKMFHSLLFKQEVVSVPFTPTLSYYIPEEVLVSI
jgi:hypothetical protein